MKYLMIFIQSIRNYYSILIIYLEPYLGNFKEDKINLFDSEKFADSRILITGTIIRNMR